MAAFQQGELADTQAPSSMHLLECSCTAGRGIEPHGRRLGNRERPANWESPCGRVPPLQRRHDQSVEHADCGHAAVVIGLQAVLMQSYDDPTSSSATRNRCCWYLLSPQRPGFILVGVAVAVVAVSVIVVVVFVVVRESRGSCWTLEADVANRTIVRR